MQFSLSILFLTSIMATSSLAGNIPMGARADTFSNFANGVGASNQPVSAKAGQPCTGTVDGLQKTGTCTANGRCGINIPPNEFDQVASADCQ
ncbi:uncharacterized protein PAC_02624 [Phialocephala subalpina]|uniref:Uncharacterized protein n=1 Tax=Phialocephala subalpina TaxID=576137 RepID=A0A1L7WIZ5_9HELO|nr:uncharacterized protein PAC_02624 [Phialocephala subalpina]